jgi:hypothetical protein
MPQLRLPVARALASLSIAAVAAAVAAAPTLAIAPTIQEVHVFRQIVSQCPDFTILATFEFDRRVTTYYDADGTPIRQTIHANLAGSFTQNTETGFTIPFIGTRYIETDLVTGTVVSTGTNAHALLPGLGTIQIGAGMTITENGELVFAAGRLDPGGSPELCAALAG